MRLKLLAMLLGVVLSMPLLVTQPAQAAAGDIGYQDQAYNGSGGAPTADKPQSKLWFNDGLWWADMFDTVSKTYHIFRLDRSNQTWVDTGTQIDNRSTTRADMLWSGGYLYAASAVKASSSASNVAGQPARLYRFSYSTTSKTYSLDPGFPANINNVSSESITLDRDSRGVLWATWTQGQSVYLNSTTAGDATWGTPYVLPTAGASGLAPDDISALAAFGNNRVGLMWSNQATSTVYVATHRDSDPGTTWTSQVAVTDPGFADDHMNLKQLEGDSLGHLYAAVKTSYDESHGPTAPQIEILALNPSSGKWDSYVYSTVADCHTRPMVVIDSTNRVLHVFATAPSSGGCPFAGSPGTIYEKTSPLNNISFAPGRGSPVIRDSASPNMNDVTGTKQNVTGGTGLVVLASNDGTSRYWHADIPLVAQAPDVSFTASPTQGVAPLDVSFTDTSSGPTLTSWSWTFGDGDTSAVQNPTHTFTRAGTYTVGLTGTTSAGATASATRTVTVQAVPVAPTASFTASPVSGTAPLQVGFTDTSGGEATSWLWDFGDGVTSTSQNPSHTYTSPGSVHGVVEGDERCWVRHGHEGLGYHRAGAACCGCGELRDCDVGGRRRRRRRT